MVKAIRSNRLQTHVVPDRRTLYEQHRDRDAKDVVWSECFEILNKAISQIEKIELDPKTLPTKTHRKIAERHRERLVRELNKLRYL